MDSALSVIIGALIALTGSSLIPWLREFVGERRRREWDYREELREATRGAILALSEMYYTPAEDVTVEAAIRHKTRIIDLAIVVRGDDRPVSAVIEHAAGCMWNDDAATELGAFRAATEVVPLWFRGGCKTEEIFDLYTQKAALWAGIRRAADEAERAEESPY